ncbi:MAG: ribonuclease PH [Candidatus Babeliales bacterium]|jgi:ribonuclease PH
MEGNRQDGRTQDQIRTISITYDAFGYADASLLFVMGHTKVLISVSIKQGVPQFLKGSGKGWLTAEYAMLPCATGDRTMRESQQNQRNTRSVEISRLIGRCLRSVVNLDCIGERTITIDCDVLQADGSTRVACITGASRALELAYRRWLNAHIVSYMFFKEPIAAISAGCVNGLVCVDLAYAEDSQCDADFNFVFTQSGNIIEIQGTAEKAPLSEQAFDQLKKGALQGVQALFQACNTFPFPEDDGTRIIGQGLVANKKQQAKAQPVNQATNQMQSGKGQFFSLAQRVSK